MQNDAQCARPTIPQATVPLNWRLDVDELSDLQLAHLSTAAVSKLLVVTLTNGLLRSLNGEAVCKTDLPDDPVAGTRS